jgi:hypothetical protein
MQGGQSVTVNLLFNTASTAYTLGSSSSITSTIATVTLFVDPRVRPAYCRHLRTMHNMDPDASKGTERIKLPKGGYLDSLLIDATGDDGTYGILHWAKKFALYVGQTKVSEFTWDQLKARNTVRYDLALPLRSGAGNDAVYLDPQSPIDVSTYQPELVIEMNTSGTGSSAYWYLLTEYDIFYPRAAAPAKKAA